MSSLTEEDILEKFIELVKEKIQERKNIGKDDIIDCHLGIDENNGKYLLVADTVKGRGFFWIEIKNSEIVLSTPTRTLVASVDELFKRISE